MKIHIPKEIQEKIGNTVFPDEVINNIARQVSKQY